MKYVWENAKETKLYALYWQGRCICYFLSREEANEMLEDCKVGFPNARWNIRVQICP
jgi:hypothetical protein